MEEDIIKIDVPLFIRILEFAREDAAGDVDLHVVADNAINLANQGIELSMDNYEDVIQSAKVKKDSYDDEELIGEFTRHI